MHVSTGGLMRQRQFHDQASPAALTTTQAILVLGVNAAIERSDDLTGDRKAKARIAPECRAFRPLCVEAFEHRFEIFGRDAWPLIVDDGPNDGAILGLHGFDRNQNRAALRTEGAGV